jgi:hypothetical protein
MAWTATELRWPLPCRIRGIRTVYAAAPGTCLARLRSQSRLPQAAWARRRLTHHDQRPSLDGGACASRRRVAGVRLHTRKWILNGQRQMRGLKIPCGATSGTRSPSRTNPPWSTARSRSSRESLRCSSRNAKAAKRTRRSDSSTRRNSTDPGRAQTQMPPENGTQTP